MSGSKGNKRPLGNMSITSFMNVSNSAKSDAVVESPSKRTKRERCTGFDSKWNTDFPWVKEVDRGMLCELCIKHQRRPKRAAVGQATWVDQPCTWIVRKALTRHEESESHNEAKSFEASRNAPVNIQGAVERMTSLQLQARVVAFRNIYWLLKNEIPHSTKYELLNNLSKLNGVNILENMDLGDNNNGKSKRFIQEAVLTIGRILREDLVEVVRKSPWYAILIDETTDVAVVNEMIVYIRYLKDGVSHTDFLAVVALHDGKADTILTAIIDLLDFVNLPLDRMCAFGSDGAAVMVGRQNGVAAQLRRRVPHMINNHCVAHRLALAASQAVKGVPYLPRFKDVLGDLYRFYAKSPVRTNGLKDIQKLLNEPALKLVEAKDVRWLSHEKATDTLMKCLPSVYTSLEREAEERNDVRAAGLAKFTQDPRFIKSLHMMSDVLPHLSELSVAMQTRDAVYTTMKPLVKGTLAILRGLLAEPGEAFQSSDERVTRLIGMGFNIREPSTSHVNNFRNQIYNPFLKNVIANIEDRFPDIPILQKFDVFNTNKFPIEEPNSHGEDEIKELAEHFNLPIDKTISEWRHVKASLSDSHLSADKGMEWVTSNLTHSHTNIFKIAAVGLLVPTSTADCERGFSSLKRIKTTHRASLNNASLNSLLAVSIRGNPIHQVDFIRIVKAWHGERPRRTEV